VRKRNMERKRGNKGKVYWELRRKMKQTRNTREPHRDLRKERIAEVHKIVDKILEAAMKNVRKGQGEQVKSLSHLACS
jgi:hypothetical protein